MPTEGVYSVSGVYVKDEGVYADGVYSGSSRLQSGALSEDSRVSPQRTEEVYRYVASVEEWLLFARYSSIHASRSSPNFILTVAQ